MRQSRFSTAPTLNAKGQPRVALETDFMVRVLKVMARYPFLNADWIAALAGVSKHVLINQFYIWKREPNFIIRVAEYQKRRPELYMTSSLVYQPGPKGEAILRMHDTEVNHDEWSGLPEHRLMSCQTRASFDLGLSDGLSIMTWEEISRFYEQNRGKPPTPYIPTGSYTKHLKPKAMTMHADCNPFILIVNGKRHYFPGIELDRDTEALSVIAGKCKDADAILSNKKIINSALAFPDLTFLFVTVNNIRMKNMQRTWLQTVKPEHKQKALFKVFKNEPVGWALTSPWHYADGAPFTFQPQEIADGSQASAA